MTKGEQRAILKRLQGIVNNRADEDISEVVQELHGYIANLDLGDATEPRKQTAARDRKERASRDRKEG